MATGKAVGLTVREHMLLAHAELRGSSLQREGTLRDVFCADGVRTPTQVHAEIVALLERPEAEAAYPVLVHRLRRVRDARRAYRSTKRASLVRQDL